MFQTGEYVKHLTHICLVGPSILSPSDSDAP